MVDILLASVMLLWFVVMFRNISNCVYHYSASSGYCVAVGPTNEFICPFTTHSKPQPVLKLCVRRYFSASNIQTNSATSSVAFRLIHMSRLETSRLNIYPATKVSWIDVDCYILPLIDSINCENGKRTNVRCSSWPSHREVDGIVFPLNFSFLFLVRCESIVCDT